MEHPWSTSRSSRALSRSVALVVISWLGLAAHAESPAPPSTPAARLSRLAEVWTRVRVEHPWVNSRDLDWDAAWVKAAPLAEQAQTPEAFRAAVDGMLATLADPASRVVPRAGPAAAPPDAPFLAWRKSVAVLALEALDGELARATGVVVDLRGASPYAVRPYFQRLEVLHPVHPVAAVERFVVWSSFTRPGFEEYPWDVPPAAKRARPVAFLAGPQDDPTPAQSFIASGEALLVTTAPLTLASLVTTTSIPLDEDFEAAIRLGEIISPSELDLFRSDVVAPAGKDPVTAAVQALARPPRRTHRVSSFGLGARVEPEDQGPAFPSRELRMLAGVKVWMVMSNFWAYRRAHPDALEGVLEQVLPRLAASKDEREYGRVMVELVARFPDAHTAVWGPAIQGVRPRAGPAVSVIPVGDGFVIDAVAERARAAGFAVGDVIEAVDEVPVAAHARALEGQLSSAHPEGLRWRIAERLLLGPAGPAQVTLRGAAGARRFTFTRVPEDGYWTSTPSRHFTVLEGNVGYVHLPSLTVGEVPKMLEALRGTRAIVFDDRGYPQGTGFVIGPCLDRLSPPAVAQFFVHPPGDLFPGGYFSQQLGPCEGMPRYTGPTALLIDGRAMSQAEHTGLIFEAYAGTTFVGSPTQGTNGDVNSWPLPGQLHLQFTAHEVRHADFRPLQNVGLQPKVPVRPTVSGLRAGRDEVLEAAVRWLLHQPADGGEASGR